MSRRILPLLVLPMLAFVAPIEAQDAGKAPEMTPAQKAEMDAYTKAGTPGAPHKKLASTAGTYSVKVKNWHEPGAPADGGIRDGHAHDGARRPRAGRRLQGHDDG